MTTTGRAGNSTPSTETARRAPRYLIRHDDSASAGRHSVYDVAALNRFEGFLFSAVACVLVTRAFLAVTGYPQVGGASGLHVAHVLWGGLLLGVGLVMTLIGLGTRVRLRAAIVGGIGFGLFIDEVGKFLTKNTNYFYEPAVAVMYAVFVAFYLAVREYLYYRRLTAARRLALATALADQTLGELDEAHRAVALQLISDVPGETADLVRRGLLTQPTSGSRLEHSLTALRNRLTSAAARLYALRWVKRLVLGVILLQVVTTALVAITDLVNDGRARPTPAEVGALVSSMVTAAIMAVGLLMLLGGRRVAGLHLLQLAIIIDLLVTFVFEFASRQFAALIFLTIQLFVFQGIRFALRVESLRNLDQPLDDQHAETTSASPPGSPEG